MFDASWLTLDSWDEFLNEILSIMFEDKVNSVQELKSFSTNASNDNYHEHSEKLLET